ncbi:MAG: 16S rRNA (guanine(966)-N(2))-methyltransferase RsmD [Rhodospirillales bacterium]
MRIVGGKYRGKVLESPDGKATRPTSDRAREGLFNILEHGIPDFRLPGAHVADVFAGSGALGIEALSRGAADLVLIENDPAARRCIRTNLASLRTEDQGNCRVLSASALTLPLAQRQMDLVMMDPPYHSELTAPAIQALAQAGWLHSQTLIVIETAKDDPDPEVDGFALIKERSYGIARFLFLQQG